jgi:predicted nucleic acid-binding Zn finger protein
LVSVRIKREEKAEKLARDGSVKLHLFLPSKREIWTVLGVEGEHYVDDKEPFCSCKHFHFKVMSNLDKMCSHLKALKIAKAKNTYSKYIFHDGEYYYILRALLKETC